MLSTQLEDTSRTTYLSLLTVRDADRLYKLISESRDGLKNLTWAADATLKSTTSFLAAKSSSNDKVYGVFTGHGLVGVIELRDKGDVYELGYWLGTKHRGQGLMKDASKYLVEEASKRRPVVAHIRVGNIPSFKTLVHAGLRPDHVETWEGEDWLHLRAG